MFGNRVWLILDITAFLCFSGYVVSCGSTDEAPLSEPVRGVESTRQALQVGPAVDGGTFEEEEETGVQQLEGYLYPRFFPSVDVVQSKRVLALNQLTALRAAAGTYNYDPGSDTCAGKCTDVQACFSGTCADACLPFGDPNFPCTNGTAKTTPAGCFCAPSGGGNGSPGLPASGCGWVPLGPTNVSGRVNSLVFDPGDQNRLVAGTVGGIWISPNKGRTWQRVVLPGVAGTQISSLAFNTAPRELFAGVSEPSRGVIGDGIWMSTGSGDSGTWSKISNAEIDSSRVMRVRAQPTAGGKVYAATSKGLYVGTRSGGTWAWSLLDGMDGNVDDIAVDFAASPLVVYAAVRSGGPKPGVWRHNGSAWSQVHAGIATAGGLSTADGILRARFAVGAPGTTIYLRINSSVLAADGLYSITNSTNAWSPISTAGVMANGQPDSGGTFYSLLEVDPAPAGGGTPTIYFGTQRLWARSPSGIWTDIRTPAPPSGVASVIVHVDQHSLAFDPSNSRVLYSGNDGGVFRSTDTSLPNWEWRHTSHGMQTTQLYRVASQQGQAASLAIGIQDAGFGVTFGNRTWYGFFEMCDGFDVGVDAGNSSLLFTACQQSITSYTNPVNYSPGGGSAIGGFTVLPAGVGLATPNYGVTPKLVPDPSISLTALVRGIRTSDAGKEYVLKTVDAHNWQALSVDIPAGAKITAMAISSAPSPSAKYYYVAVQPPGAGQGAVVYTSSNAGTAWSGGVAAGTAWINSIAVDPVDPKTAWIASRDGSVRQTKDGGATWAVLGPNDNVSILPPAAAVTGIVATTGLVSNTQTTLYVATNVGVFEGNLTPNGKVNWYQFDFGLPDGIDVNDIQANLQARTLVIGTWGHGVYRYVFPPVGAEVTCRGVQLLIRDNVFDQGRSPSVSGVPDPEWPEPIDRNATPLLYRPNETDRVYFWESTDIRTEVPSVHDTTAFNCPWAPGVGCPVDSVEFDGCPIQVGTCPAWAVRNTDPIKSPLPPLPPVTTNFYVQVTNNGLATANKVRVVTLLADASAGVPPLPSTFWSQTVAPGMIPEAPASPCGAMAAGPWTMVGCKVMDKQIGPASPEVAQFPFAVPSTATSHSCMLAIVDSAADPVVPGANATNVEALAQAERHVALRNLHVVDGPSALATSPNEGAGTSTARGIPFSGLSTLKIPNRWNTAGTHQVRFSRNGMESTGRLAVLLPSGKTAPGLPPKCGVIANAADAIAISLPKGVAAGALALSASGTLDIADRAVISAAGGGVANAGSGQTTVGSNAKVGTVWSVGNVLLRDHATVAGDVNLGGTLTQQDPVFIQGNVRHVTLSPADILSWTITWPSTSGGNRDVQPGQQLTEAPGRLGLVSVKGGATLKLMSGVYFMDALTLESQSPPSTLLLDQSAGPTTIYTRQGFTFRGTNRTTSGAAPDLLVVAIGSNDVWVETPFTGSVVAPTARLTVGGNDGTFAGSFFAKDLTVRADVKVVDGPAMAWANLPACRALTAAEKSAATAAGLATTLYPIVGQELNQQLPIPYGQTWTIGLRYDSGVGRTGTASRFRVMSLYQGQIMGGNTFLLRQ